jgi:hypothetical protein
METMLDLRKRHYVTRVSIFLITAALVWGMIGCGITGDSTEYELTISSTSGGNVTIPGEGTFTCIEGMLRVLVAAPDEGYRFASWDGDVGTVADTKDASTTIRVYGRYSITANFEEIPVYNLTVSATVGGWVITPGEGTFTRNGGMVVNLVAREHVSYGFVNWTGDVQTIDDVNADSTFIVMEDHYSITANFEKEEAVTITDPSLEAVIRAAIDEPEREIYPSDLKKFTSLRAEQSNISNVVGLEYCIGLTELYLDDNHLSDISPLASLTSLTEINLSRNQISDISPLAGLTGLTHLELWNNQISDISPLAGLTGLTHLELWNNQISDISPMAGLTGLTHLELWNNQISDISPLAGLTGLTHLELWNNQISDISPLANLASLAELDIAGNQIGDISPLVENEGLSEGDNVDLRWNPLSSDSINIYIPQLEARGVTVDY